MDDEVGNLRLGRLPGLGGRDQAVRLGHPDRRQPDRPVSVDVTGRTALQLVVTNGGDNDDYDHADWADAKLTCGGGAPIDTTPPTVTATTPANGATGVAATISPTGTFSEAMTPTTVTARA